MTAALAVRWSAPVSGGEMRLADEIDTRRVVAHRRSVYENFLGQSHAAHAPTLIARASRTAWR